jgi:hypothetical protein
MLLHTFRRTMVICDRFHSSSLRDLQTLLAGMRDINVPYPRSCNLLP